jgi:hypothetical protein
MRLQWTREEVDDGPSGIGWFKLKTIIKNKNYSPQITQINTD